MEHAFRQVEGVLGVQVGYSGGFVRAPSYRNVCSGRTGHAEVVLVEFHPDIVSYSELLETFWDIHDPTTLNRQGPDLGSQYRSAIFYFDEGQLETAERSRKERQRELEADIVTEIKPAGESWRAEDYHQRYYEKNGRSCCR